MIVDERKVPRAERFGAIVDLGLVAWAARWPFYIAIAAASVGLELCAALLTHYDALVLTIVMQFVDGFATALVSLDVFARFSGDVRGLRELTADAFARWPVVTLTLLVVMCVDFFILPLVFGSQQDTLFGALILPGLGMLGILGLATPIASLERVLPFAAIPGFALIRSMIYAGVWPNLGRLAIAGAMLAVPLMLQQLLEPWLSVHGLDAGRAFFWANAPIDALFLAPFQAFFTYLYLDFTVREQHR